MVEHFTETLAELEEITEDIKHISLHTFDLDKILK